MLQPTKRCCINGANMYYLEAYRLLQGWRRCLRLGNSTAPAAFYRRPRCIDRFHVYRPRKSRAIPTRTFRPSSVLSTRLRMFFLTVQVYAYIIISVKSWARRYVLVRTVCKHVGRRIGTNNSFVMCKDTGRRKTNNSAVLCRSLSCIFAHCSRYTYTSSFFKEFVASTTPLIIKSCL